MFNSMSAVTFKYINLMKCLVTFYNRFNVGMDSFNERKKFHNDNTVENKTLMSDSDRVI